MKRTEQRWMHPNNRHIAEVNDPITKGYISVTVTWDEPEWEDVKVNADPQSPNSVWYTDERGVTRQVPKDAEIIAVFRRRKPEPEAWESHIRIGALGNYVDLPSSATDHGGKKVRVEVVE